MIYSLLKAGRQHICRTTGLCLAVSMMTAITAFTVCGSTRCGGRFFTADNSAKLCNPSDSSVTEISISEPTIPTYVDSRRNEKAYEKLIRESRNRRPSKNRPSGPQETQSTTAVTQNDAAEWTTLITTTTVSTQTTSSATTAADREEEDNTASVSNGMKPFNYNDVSSVASDLNTHGDFAEKLRPSLISWNAEKYAENGCVEITMDSAEGSVVLDVKPLDNTALDEEPSGSVSGSDAMNWSWLRTNQTAGCNISSVVWKDARFGISPVRGIAIGSTLARLTDHYLCVNGGANTLYKASDVIEDQNKLNAILAAENLFTFVGGRVYSIGSYLDKYYNGREHTFLFEDCDYVVQYGCNSIMDHNYTTGSWIIEYAVREDQVIGISFMNKSYYKNEQKTAISATISSSGTELAAATTHTESFPPEDHSAGDEPEDNPSEPETEPSSTTAAD